MSFFDDERALQGGYRLNSPLKVVNHIKFGARGDVYLCKVTVAARSPYGRPPARRVGIAFPCAAAVVCAAVGCTVPPWGVPCRRGVCPARAPGWKEHQRRPLHSPLVGLDRCFRGLMGVARRGGKSTSAGRLFPLMGLDGARKVRPAHQLFSAPSSPTLLRAQLTNFTPHPAHPEC